MRTISRQLRCYRISRFSGVLYSFALGASLLLGQVLGQAQITRVGDVAWDLIQAGDVAWDLIQACKSGYQSIRYSTQTHSLKLCEIH